MDKPFNLQVVDTKQEILKAIEQSHLPATAIQMILKEISQAVDIQTQNIIQNEKIEYEKAQQDVQE